jgi:actin beta/gamma 1
MDKKGRLMLKYPMEHGIITDWEAMNLVWSYIYKRELRINSEEHPLLVLESPLTPIHQRHKTAMIFFEEYNVPAFHLAPTCVAGLMASGRNSGIMLDIGDGVLSVVPILNGRMVAPGVRRMNFGGRDLTRYLARLLTESGVYLGNRSADLETIRYMKETTCYVALNFEEEMALVSRSNEIIKEFTLPDDQVIQLNSERSRCPEALFQPSLVGLESPGVHQLVYDAIAATRGDNVPLCYSNIVLSGASTLFRGFADRLHKEMTNLAPVAAKIKVVAPPERNYSNWIGGGIMSNLTHGVSWISKEQYDESGAGIVDVMCRYF